METKEQTPHVNVDYFEELTGIIHKHESDHLEEIGSRIRSVRESKGLTLNDLSKLTGFDVSLLSQIEQNEVQPQLGTIIKLSKALDSALTRLISDSGDKVYSITRRDEQKIISRSSSQRGKKRLYTYKSLAPEVKGRHMEALTVILEEHPEEELSVHEGEEFIYVLEGQVTLKIGDERFELDPGDSAYYLSTTPHMVASKKGKAAILAVLYEG